MRDTRRSEFPASFYENEKHISKGTCPYGQVPSLCPQEDNRRFIGKNAA